MAKHKITIESENIEELVQKLIYEFKKFELAYRLNTSSTHVCRQWWPMKHVILTSNMKGMKMQK